MKIWNLAIGLLNAALLSGCYITDTPIIEKGEKTPIAGTYQCHNYLTKKNTRHSYIEKKEGTWPFARYSYIEADGDVNLFRKSPTGLYVAQSANNKGKFSYAFLDIIGEKEFIILISDAMGKKAYIDALLKKNNVESKETRNMEISLKGDKDKILNFLNSHDKSLLTVTMKCESNS